ncbi:transcription factor of the Forkhead-HNF3 family [Enterocytozoon bieneusi H348]|nr:transcription factor of the Forkhead-HNF3 family [Enterocytozoon bieneusi H348]|eukprot:XP_001827989.1 transcription factor of the Forkhead-HNF3 family [Enterocytozoon bieneusi H348]
MFFNSQKLKEPENKKNQVTNETFNDIFKIPSDDNYLELCQILMDKEEKKEYISPIFDTCYNSFINSETYYKNNLDHTNNNSLFIRDNINNNISYFNNNQINFNNSNISLQTEFNKYATNKTNEKPDDSYAYMILRALSSSKNNMMTLSEIYTWIEQNYPYFKTADAIWKNSIRHNLSLNAAFKKTPRQANQKGKGGFWSIVDDKEIVRKINKKRRITRNYIQHDLNNEYYNNLNNSF